VVRIIFGVLISAIGGYTFYLGISGLTSKTEGSWNSTVGRAVVAIFGLGIVFVGIAMMFVH
jgi:hypothetical protein